MKKELRTAVYDHDLHIEAYRLQGIIQPFPPHFHEHYVVGYVESGERRLTCRNQEYLVPAGYILLFNPGDSHGCVQTDGRTFDYRGLNIPKEVINLLAQEITGSNTLPYFSRAVFTDEEIACCLRTLQEMILTCTMASNVGVIVSVSPFFTALLTAWFFRGAETMGRRFFLGFLVAMSGISLISFHSSALAVSPKGDLLALLAAIVWAFYSVLTKHIGTFGFPTVLVTRRIFFYGLLFMLPALPFFSFSPDLTRLGDPGILGNLLFLGLGASALCFVTWNFSVRTLGAVKTSLYIYVVPVVTVISSMLVLHETLTPLAWLGVGLTLMGLFLSQSRSHQRTEAQT